VLKLHDRTIIRFAPFGMDLIFSIYSLAAPLVLIELKASPVELGLVGTITSSVHMAMANLMGPLSDRLGRRRLIITAPVILATSCLAMILAKEVNVILALSAINGLCLSLFWPPFQAWIADLRTDSGLARDIGSFNLSWTAANFAGPIFSGFLFGLYPRIPFFLAAILSVTLFFLIRASIRDKERQPVETAEPEPNDLEASNGRMKFLYAVWVANFASWFIIGNARYQFPKLAREMDIAPHVIGLLIAGIGFSLFMGFLILRENVDWHFRRSYLLGSQVLAGSGLLLFVISNQPLLFALALILIGMGSSVTYYSSLYYAVHLIRKKGRGTGIHESIVGSGALLGPILGGIAAQYAGLRTPYLLCLAVLFLAVVAELNLTRRIPSSQA
jgi:MFS family permease